MKRPTLVLPLLLLLAVTSFPTVLAATDVPSLRIVVHADNTAAQMDRERISSIFYKKVQHWEQSGQLIVPVDQSRERPVREVFSRVIHGRSSPEMEKYWQRMIFAARGIPPTKLSSDQAVLAYVRDHPGAIGYVQADTPLLPGVRSLSVAGLVTAADVGGQGWVTYDEILAERGQVRLMLTGTCGPNDQGREALLQNRNSVGPVRVTTETSQWTRGEFKSNSRDVHVLEGHQEKRLGCTHLSNDVELRYALAKTSDNSSQADWRDHGAPLRDFISLVASGTCGQKGEGQRIVAVNRHSNREIVVSIRRVQKLNGDLKNRALKSYRLRPGGEREVGCDRLGNLTQEFHLVENH